MHACTFAKRKVRMRAGQTDQALTVNDPRLLELGQRLGEALRHIGMLDCDVFDTPDGLRVIDLNPRMGGGYPFAHLAGANYPAALLAWARGEQPDPRWLQMEPNVFSSICDAAVRHRALSLTADEKPGSEPIPCAA
jgi:carbamoyl-phosphate synthase large subunit